MPEAPIEPAVPLFSPSSGAEPALPLEESRQYNDTSNTSPAPPTEIVLDLNSSPLGELTSPGQLREQSEKAKTHTSELDAFEVPHRLLEEHKGGAAKEPAEPPGAAPAAPTLQALPEDPAFSIEHIAEDSGEMPPLQAAAETEAQTPPLSPSPAPTVGTIIGGVKTVARRFADQTSGRPLEWPSGGLATQAHNLGPKLAKLFEAGAKCAVILSSVDGGSRFDTVVSVESSGRVHYWTDLHFDSGWVPDLWKNLSRSTAIEIAPPPEGKMANPASSRNVCRAAFGTKTTEWLSLFLAGSNDKPHTLVAVFSQTSLQGVLGSIKPDLKGVSPIDLSGIKPGGAQAA